MKRNFNFLIDAFKNLSGEYKFGIFIHKNHWDIFYQYLSQQLNISSDSFSRVQRVEMTENFIFFNYKNSKMFIYKINNNPSQMPGQRYNFVFWDELIDDSIVNEIIKHYATLPPCYIASLNIKNKCHYCICKTCAIAEINGGAQGCGNCKNCNLIDGHRSCNEYYNPEPHINDIIDKMLECSRLSPNYAYVFPKDTNGDIKIEYIGDFIKEEESE